MLSLMPDPAALVAVAFGYLLGAVPFALLLGLSAGIDLRVAGTGNVGAGNLTRQAGLRFGIPAAVLDGLKGLAPILLARRLGMAEGMAAVCGVAAVVGHNWSIYLRARAGRGLATAVGAVVGIAPGLLIWTGSWAVLGWWIGGGPAGFLGWGLLAPAAVVSGQGAGTLVAAAALTIVVLVRRMQGNRGAPTDMRSRLRRMVWDTDGVVPHDASGARKAMP
ncbi:MAG: glycerol-3-phosphate acyltransferase [Actinomycetota bacterium]